MASMKDNDALHVENSMDLLLVLLFAPGKTGREGEPIEGITRLQKLIFLLQQGKGPGTLVEQAKEFLYKPYKMGPYCASLMEDLEVLKSAGLVRTERLEYLLTDDADTDDDQDASGIGNTGARSPRRVESSRFLLTDEGLDVARELWESLEKKSREGLREFKAFFNALSLRQLLIFVYEKYPKFAEASTIKAQLGL